MSVRLMALLLCPAVLLAPACSDDVQGSLRLLLAAPHQGRNPTQDPFELVDQVEIGFVTDAADFLSMGIATPTSSFGPGLVESGRQGAPYLLGLNNRDRPVAHGYGPFLALQSGVDHTLTVPFSQIDTAVATRIAAFEREAPDPFVGKTPSLFVDHRHVEQPPIDGPGDLTALVTALWQGEELLLQIRVADDVVTEAGAESPLVEGDAVTVFLEDVAVTVAPDGRQDPPAAATSVESGPTSNGYLVRMALPLTDAAKNQQRGFDIRVHDRDEDAPLAFATWRFDPRREGGEPLPEDFGRLVLGTPLLDLLEQPGSAAAFATADGIAEITGRWDGSGATIEVSVADDELVDGDLVEFWFDLANGVPPAPEPVRFVRFTGSARSTVTASAGESPDSVTELGSFGGTVLGGEIAGGYQLTLFVPWSDLQLLSGTVQRGWFFGMDVRVVDVDTGGEATYAWSDLQDLRPELWPELRFFSME